MTETLLFWVMTFGVAVACILIAAVVMIVIVILTYVLARACSYAWHKTKYEFSKLKPNGESNHG